MAKVMIVEGRLTFDEVVFPESYDRRQMRLKFKLSSSSKLSPLLPSPTQSVGTFNVIYVGIGKPYSCIILFLHSCTPAKPA